MALDECEKNLAAAADAVRNAKANGATKDELAPLLNHLAQRKIELTHTLNEMLDKLAPDSQEAQALRLKLPPEPSKKSNDKKKATSADDAAKKEANKKAQEEAKMAARAKKKASADAKAAVAPAKAAVAPAKAAAAAAAGTTTAAATLRAAPANKPNKKIHELHYLREAPPYLALVAMRLARVEVFCCNVERKTLPLGADSVLYLPGNRGEIAGGEAIARYLARLAPVALEVYGAPSDPLSASEVDSWICICAGLLRSPVTSAVQAGLAAILNRRLRMRSFLCGYDTSLADASAWLVLRLGPDDCEKVTSEAGAPVALWWKSVNACAPMNDMAKAHLGQSKENSSMEIPLPGAEKGKVVTRFPPEPSGHLHIGHVKACLLNAYFAEEYEGKMLLRFDDTNPSKEKEEYEAAITVDIERLGIKPAAVSHTSDWFETILGYATRMLEQGLAFVDPMTQEEQQALRMKRQPSPHREQAVEENLRLWAEMQAASEEGLRCCVRAKIDSGSANGTMRDPCIYRCNLLPHAKTGSRYKVYPTYDLACPIVDSLEGVTHALRDRNYIDRDVQYAWFLSTLKLRKVEIWGFSRVNFKQTLLSKRKLQWMIDEKLADGWDDPRFPTVAGILRRGMRVPALRSFIISLGASKNVTLMEWDKIWAFNKAVVDPTAARYTVLLAEGLVPLRLAGAPATPFFKPVPRHPKEAIGNKMRLYAPTVLLQADDAAAIADGEEVTLMTWGNAIAEKRAADGSAIDGRLHLEGSVKATKKKLTWLADTPDLVDIELIDLDHLLTKDSLEEDDDVDDILTPVTRYVFRAKGEPALRKVQHGEIIQVERRGFYICDQPYLRESAPMRFIFVPDSKHMMGVRGR